MGTRGYGQAPLINGAPEIIDVYFEEPIIIPAGTERILVTIHKIVDFYNPESARVVVAGTSEDTGESWYHGCDENYSLTRVSELNNPVPNANFYINVTGESNEIQKSGSITRLTHNICDDIIETNIHSCTSSYIYWARAFTLEEFVITSGQVGINKTGWLPEISFNIYKIDDNFPASFSETDLIGSSQYQQLSPNIDRNSQIIQVDFVTPIVVPANVERILVEVHKGIVYGDGVAFIAGSTLDNDVSWQRGCTNVAGGPKFDYNEYVSAADFGRPNANFYINVTGNVNHVTNNFEMNISNICSEFLKEFSVENKDNVASVSWDFGDPNSGLDNSSTDLSPFHDFSQDGVYTITATVTGKDGGIEVLTETINVKEPPNAYGIDNIYACEDTFNSGISSKFDTSGLLVKVLGMQTNKVVKFIDGSGNEYDLLPNPFTNTVQNTETITVRVAHENNLCCYSETTFDLIVNPQPNLVSVSELVDCSNETNGFSAFNLQEVKDNIVNNLSNLEVIFYYENGQQIAELLNAVQNSIANEEEITVRATNTNTNSYNETTFKLMVNPLPIANDLTSLVGCDDNGDGVSEYFNTSNVEMEVLGNQTGMEVSYFDFNGNQLPSPLPNPYTNSIANTETITVRVTNPSTTCYAEIPLVLKTASKPKINTPQTIYSCDLGNGFANFDTSNLETEIIGNQTGLKVIYFDDNGNQIPNPLPSSFQNTQAWSQTIYVRVENELNNLCFSETSFDLIVNVLPSVNIQETYFLCDLEPSLYLNVETNYPIYNWQYEDGTNISNSHEVILEKAGDYALTIGENINGEYCENTFNFELIRSVLPVIESIEYKELSDNNYINIIASGDGDFEYSIDGTNYQDNSLFNDVLVGVYTVSVRDKLGCGEDFDSITVIDYPKYFTPNNDGYNDTWQIKGIESFPNAQVFIYDRYGKLIKQIDSNSIGWDGTFNGKSMLATDYWFVVKLDTTNEFSGHFSLKM